MNKYIMEQNGRSMIEMLGVLAIVGVLSVAGIAGYSKAMAKYKVNKLIDQVSSVVANVRSKAVSIGGGRGAYFDASVAYDLGIYPEDVAKECNLKGKYEAGCTRNAFGGELVVRYGVSRQAISGDIGIAVTVTSKEACSGIVMADWGSDLEGFYMDYLEYYRGDSGGAYRALEDIDHVFPVNEMSTAELIERVCHGANEKDPLIIMMVFK